MILRVGSVATQPSLERECGMSWLEAPVWGGKKTRENSPGFLRRYGGVIRRKERKETGGRRGEGEGKERGRKERKERGRREEGERKERGRREEGRREEGERRKERK